MRAILVCVEYSDLLAITLPYNRHHFDEVIVVTSHADKHNVQPICQGQNVLCYATDSFYKGGAKFNKWLSLEEGLDWMGRSGWLCLLDADVLIPYNADLSRYQPGNLYGPLRRMLPLLDPPQTYHHGDLYASQYFPPESDWAKYPLHPNLNEWAGYCQIFHADDPLLGKAPWHETNWRHAGGADSYFQNRWPSHKKIRTPWQVLHMGEAGQNWAGRTTPRLDGVKTPDADKRQQYMRQMWLERRRRRGADRYEQEKL